MLAYSQGFSGQSTFSDNQFTVPSTLLSLLGLAGLVIDNRSHQHLGDVTGWPDVYLLQSGARQDIDNTGGRSIKERTILAVQKEIFSATFCA